MKEIVLNEMKVAVDKFISAHSIQASHIAKRLVNFGVLKTDITVTNAIC